MTKNIEIGDLVKWYEYYADGDIVRNAGTGIVLEHTNTGIKIFCTEKCAAQWFSIREIDLIRKQKKQKGVYKPDKNIKKEI